MLSFIFTLPCACALGQEGERTPLFDSDETLRVRMSFSFKDLKESDEDTVYFPTRLEYQNADSSWSALDVRVRARGNYRRKNCSFPPVRMKIKKSDAASTLFEGNKNLKLVLPCRSPANYIALVAKEYVCYKLYEAVCPYTLRTRLARIALIDQRSKGNKSFDVPGFFIEDDDHLARRFDGEILDESKIHPLHLHDSTALIHDFFQLMIGNTDWSSVVEHNIYVLQVGGRVIPVAFDFDMSGMVNAPYAVVNEALVSASNVRERVYRGFCRDEALVRHTRKIYLQNESRIFEVLNLEQSRLAASDFKEMESYLQEFFSILKDDRLFSETILKNCRTN